jgi:hypothetical protein
MFEIVAFLVGTTVAAAPLLAESASHHGKAERRTDAEQLQRTAEAIRAAYDRGDVAGSMAYHHPDIVKAACYDRLLVGSRAVEDDFRRRLGSHATAFVGREVEHLLLLEGMAIQTTRLTARRTPTGGGEPAMFRARTMSVYVRSGRSPTGWALIRAIVQPEAR